MTRSNLHIADEQMRAKRARLASVTVGAPAGASCPAVNEADVSTVQPPAAARPSVGLSVWRCKRCRMPISPRPILLCDGCEEIGAQIADDASREECWPLDESKQT